MVKLVRAGFKEKTVIAIIRSRPNHFNLEPDRLIELKRNGVTENIILTMLALNESFESDDEWSDDDSFFKRSGRVRTTVVMPSLKSSDRVEDRRPHQRKRMSGSNEGDTRTTGSATVRIIRPPAEAGSAVPKLEKTHTLTNESIIQLVEAGFSEGTIIKESRTRRQTLICLRRNSTSFANDESLMRLLRL